MVPVTIPDTGSGFKHRGELVYLPPAWYATYPPPPLPTVMMIGGEFNTPADWLRAGNAVQTIDDFAAAHGGNAPVFVFVDSGGAFNNDTECVNGTRAKAAVHTTKDVVPFMVSRYDVSPSRANWGVVGWSMGGTCAVDLTVMHPDMFSTFEDIAGDMTPNAGNKAQTIARLFGANAAAYAAFNPTTVITHHGPYAGVTGRSHHRRGTVVAAAPRGGERGGQPQRPNRRGELAVRDGAPTASNARGPSRWGTTGRPRARACGAAAVAGGPARHTRPASDSAARPPPTAQIVAAACSAAVRTSSAGGGE